MSIFKRKRRSDILWEQYIRLRDMAGTTIPGTETYEQVTEAMREIIEEYIFETRISEKIQQGIDLAIENQDLIKEKLEELKNENQSGRN